MIVGKKDSTLYYCLSEKHWEITNENLDMKVYIVVVRRKVMD